MYCSACGKELPTEARFCVHCGARTGVADVPPTPPPAAAGAPVRGLYRSRSQRMVAGICGGLAETYGWDLSVVRLITALSMIFTGSIIFFAYIVAWVVVPEEPLLMPPPPQNPPA